MEILWDLCWHTSLPLSVNVCLGILWRSEAAWEPLRLLAHLYCIETRVCTCMLMTQENWALCLSDNSHLHFLLYLYVHVYLGSNLLVHVNYHNFTAMFLQVNCSAVVKQLIKYIHIILTLFFPHSFFPSSRSMVWSVKGFIAIKMWTISICESWIELQICEKEILLKSLHLCPSLILLILHTGRFCILSHQ